MANRPAIFFACTTLVLAAALAWSIAPPFVRATEESPNENIVFPNKVFTASTHYVAAKGSLVGDWMAYKNNTYSILCLPEECIVASIDQIARNLVSSIDGPVTYPIKRWTEDSEVVAESDGICSRTTITLDRRSKSVLWVETPINQTAMSCKSAETAVHKATLEAARYWRKSR
jgi:hypothetical protein